MVNHIEKIKTLFTDPGSFFKSVVKENKYFPILLYFVIIFVVGQLVESVFSLPAAIKKTMESGIGGPFLAVVIILGILLALFFSVIIAFVVPFISSAMNHLGVLIVGGKEGYFNTFKPTTYSMIIGVVYGLLSSLILSVLNLINPVDISNLETLSLQNLPILNIVIAVIIGLAAFIHTIYAEVAGISLFQRISRGRALVAVLILPILLFLFIVIMGIGLGFMKAIVTGMGVLG